MQWIVKGAVYALMASLIALPGRTTAAAPIQKRPDWTLDFVTGKKLYAEGRYAEGLEKVDAAASALRASEGEIKDAVGIYTRIGIWTHIAQFYLSLGCHQKAISILDKNIQASKAVQNYSSLELYFRSLRMDAHALREAGHIQKAIELQSELLNLYRTKNDRGVHSATVMLALLYRDAGQTDKTRQLMPEIRKGYERRWRKNLRGTLQITDEAWLLTIEGRYKEAEKLLQNALAIEQKKSQPDRRTMGRIYWGLASIYDRTGEADKHLAAIKTRHDLYEPSKRFNQRRYVILAKAYKKAGQRTEAKKLADKYKLCLN